MAHQAIDYATRAWLGVLVPSVNTVAGPKSRAMRRPGIGDAPPGFGRLFDTANAMRDAA